MPPMAVKAEKTRQVPSRASQPSHAAPILAQNTTETNAPPAKLSANVGSALAKKMVRADTGIENKIPRDFPSIDSAEADGQDMPMNSTANPAAM